jgi:hypothetical protein
MSEKEYWIMYSGEITKKINGDTFITFIDNDELLDEYNTWVSEGNQAIYIPSPEESMEL